MSGIPSEMAKYRRRTGQRRALAPGYSAVPIDPGRIRMTNPPLPSTSDDAVSQPLPIGVTSGEPPRNGKRRIKIRTLIGLAFLVLIAVVIVKGPSDVDKVKDAAVGACLTGEEDAEKVAVVDCAAPTAAHRVVGKVPNIDKNSFNGDILGMMCERYKTAERRMWMGSASLPGIVLCLEPITTPSNGPTPKLTRTPANK
jgi:hypothetical protein